MQPLHFTVTSSVLQILKGEFPPQRENLKSGESPPYKREPKKGRLIVLFLYKGDIVEFYSKVLNNKNEKHPYVGIVLEIEGNKYFAPLTSPKHQNSSIKRAWRSRF